MKDKGDLSEPALAGDIIHRRASFMSPLPGLEHFNGANPQLALWAIDISPASLAD
jgi:hypothetical protein